MRMIFDAGHGVEDTSILRPRIIDRLRIWIIERLYVYKLRQEAIRIEKNRYKLPFWNQTLVNIKLWRPVPTLHNRYITCSDRFKTLFLKKKIFRNI